MAYTVLARRYRSATFDEVIGQEHVGRTLKKAIEADRVAHAYLFTGTRGVGKTSMARILAKALNCLSFDKATPTPCGTCDSCQRIAKGDDMDVIEIDAASNTGVDNVRDIIENAQYRPSRSRYKVYIIDEVHMLSKAAFNALLKTMEEPPSHVKFILATTEVEKVLPTILSRCQRYDFRNIPTREIAAHLREICAGEKIEADEDALLLVAKAGAGSMRDALSLLDRLLSVGERTLSTDLIEQMLGLPKSQLLFDIAGAIGDGDVKSALQRVTAMINGGQSVDGLIAALVEHLRNLLILRTCGPDSELVEVPGLAMADLVAQAERFDPAALVQDVAILEELRRHVRQSQAGRALLDATIVRMALADQFAAIGQLVARLDEGGGQGRPAARPAAAVSRPAPSQQPAPRPAPPVAADDAQKKKADELTQSPAPVSAPAPPAVAPAPPPAVADRAPPPVVTTTAPVPSASVLDSIDFGDDDLPRPGKVWDDSGPSLAEMVKGSSGSTDAPAVPVAPPLPASDDLRAVWAAALEVVKPQIGVYGVAMQSTLAAVDDEVAVVRLPASCETFAKLWERNGKREVLREAVSKAIGRPVGVRLEVEPANETAPAAQRPAAGGGPVGSNATANAAPRQLPVRAAAPPPPPPQAAAQRVTQEQIDAVKEQSPLVAALASTFNAQIVKIENE